MVLATPLHPGQPQWGNCRHLWTDKNIWKAGMYSSIWVQGSAVHSDMVRRLESIFCDLATSAPLTFIWGSLSISKPLNTSRDIKRHLSCFLPIRRYNWNSKQLVPRLFLLVTSTYFIMHLDSFIMRAVWLIFARWSPSNVQEHVQNTNMLFLLHTFTIFIRSPSMWLWAYLKKGWMSYSGHEKGRRWCQCVRNWLGAS